MKRAGMILLGLLAFICTQEVQAVEKQGFWNTGRKGANYYWTKPSMRTLNRLAAEKTDFVYYVHSEDNALCNSDLVSKENFKKIRRLLDDAHTNRLKVVLGVANFRAFMELDPDVGGRLWQSKRLQARAVIAWKRLAKKLKRHPALVGYDILPFSVTLASDEVLCDFYKKVISEIREVDSKTSIILKVKDRKSDIFKLLSGVTDANLIYSVESRPPFESIASQESPFGYPCNNCEANVQKRQLEAAFIWAKQLNIPSNRIFINYGGYLTQLGDRANFLIQSGGHWSCSR